MTLEIAAVLAILAGAVILFASEKLRVDVVALLVLVVLAISGLVTTEETFSGFSNPAVITVLAMFILTAGLNQTGIVDAIGSRLLKVAGPHPIRMTVILMLTCGTMSAFMNNVAATAILLPAVVSIARSTSIPASKLLIPLSFSSLMGGNMTLVGTPPNILASALLQDYTHLSFAFFDFLPTGIVVFATGILYMTLLGRYLLPDHLTQAELTETYRLRDYLTEVRVLPESPLIGRTVLESRFGEQYDLNILGIVRDGQTRPARRMETIREGDLLLVEGAIEQILRIQDEQGLEIEADVKLGDRDLGEGQIGIVEAVVGPRSELIGRTLKDVRFREKYGLTVLAIWREGRSMRRKLAEIPLRFGDALLIQGRRDRLQLLQSDRNFLVLEDVTGRKARRERAPIAAGIMLFVIISATLGWFHISTAAMIGAVTMVLTRCLTIDEAYAGIEWRVIFLIAGMLPLGIAMETTGTAAYLANLIVPSLGVLGPTAILGGLFLLTSFLTQPMSNAATTVLVVPIAIGVAMGMGLDPRPFVMGVVIAASTSFITPIGHQANILVMGPGGYRFLDYTRVGAPLTAIVMVVTLIVVPIIWPY